MPDVLPFRRRLAPRQPEIDRRALIEQAAQAALDTADNLIALLDAMEEDPDAEDSADAEPSLAAPEGHASQVVWLRGTDRDLELDHHQENTR